MVRLENITVSFGGKPILREVNWRVGDTDRVGLVGPNGSGKTTLLRLIKGDIDADTGEITCSKGTTFGYLPQEELTLAGRTLFDEVMTVFEALAEIEDRMRELEHEMSEVPSEGPEHDRVLKEYARLQHEFDTNDGFTIEARIAEVLAGLGFREEDRARMTEEFSGGWQMRIALAKLLLSQPAVLLLDEPTNHLDLESIVWLEAYLRDYPGAVVLVSHDREFLDRLVSRISEVGIEGMDDYTGGYSSYTEQREKRRLVLLATREQQEKKIAHLQSFVDRFRADKARAAMARSRQKMIDRMELVEVPKERRGIRFEFPEPARGGTITLALRGVKQAYGENVVFDGVDLEVMRGARVAIVGVNGAGKSTLLRVMAGRVPIQAGERKLGHNVTMQYFGQEPGRTLSPSNTVIGELESVAPNHMRPRLRSLLGAFLFTGDDIEKRVSVLSGGEKSRLAIAKMLLRPANFLLLDEPTNHLDVASREVLEDALSRYKGTICLVSHDRAFMDNLANMVLLVEDGELRFFHGNYSDYLWAIEHEGETGDGRRGGARRASEACRADGSRETPGRRGGPKSREQKRAEAEARKNMSKAKRAARDERRRICEEIATAEARLEELEIALADPSVYTDGEKTRALVNEQRTLRTGVDELYERWAALED